MIPSVAVPILALLHASPSPSRRCHGLRALAGGPARPRPAPSPFRRPPRHVALLPPAAMPRGVRGALYATGEGGAAAGDDGGISVGIDLGTTNSAVAAMRPAGDGRCVCRPCRRPPIPVRSSLR